MPEHDNQSMQPLTRYTNIIFNTPGSEDYINNWATGIEYIINNYNTPRPHFRSTWRRFLSGNNKTKFYNILSRIISAILLSHNTEDDGPFWWILFHFEMIILAPKANDEDRNRGIKQIIRQRLLDFQCGNIEQLVEGTLFNNNWNTKTQRPQHKTHDSAAQQAADSDNYRTAITRACTFNKIATINEDNISTVNGLYPSQRTLPITEPTSENTNELALPGNICQTIRQSGKNKGTGIFSDSIDTLIHLVNKNDTTTNNNIQSMFNLIYQGKIPQEARHFFTDTYLFCLHKDERDNKKLRPIGIPTALRRIIASHVAKQWKDKFALHLLPYNYAVGVPNGMDFIIKTMQLSIERFIEQPQLNHQLPTRSAIFVDLTNMFNSVSRAELFDVIESDFPELHQLTSLLYADFGTVHFKWNQNTWKQLYMEDGVNQGCPLSPIFATLVLHRVLRPLAESLASRAANRVSNGDTGDDGFGSLAHLFAYMDDISSTVAHEDIEFFCTEIERLGKSRGCIVNPEKTRILTSCTGESILPLLDKSTSETIEQTINKYSIQTHKDGTISPVELTSGFRLLGTPVGSASFAHEFYVEQQRDVNRALESMMTHITDTQTRLKLFSQCTSQKLPHLLDSDIMHNYPIHDDSYYEQWYNWAGPLSNGIDDITTTFLQQLIKLDTTPESLPQLARLICHLNINKGGLGLINPSLRATPDFVINMMISKRRTTRGFNINEDILPITLHESITNLYNYDVNTTSKCLQRYYGLLPHIAPLCCSDSIAVDEQITAFEQRISPHSARSRLKKWTGNIITNQIYTEATNNNNEHLHLIPSLLSPQTSYPLIGMCRSNKQNRLPNWITDIAIKRKLRLPIHNSDNPPTCKCGKVHDVYGDHAFRCKKISKKMAHNIIRDSWAEALQPALATAGYINNTSKLDIERRNINTRDIGAQPFDISFDPDPSITDSNNVHCPYTTIGMDITIGNSCANIPSSKSVDVTSVTALADSHLHTLEHRKFTRRDKTDDDDTSPTTIIGDEVIGDLLANNMILLPFALDSFGRFGPIMRHFLHNTINTPPFRFRNKPHATTMAYRATNQPCPLGILRIADSIWKTNPTRTFFGYSYTAPTPSISTIQKLGLGITKGFAVLLRNANKISYSSQNRPNNTNVATQAQYIDST